MAGAGKPGTGRSWSIAAALIGAALALMPLVARAQAPPDSPAAPAPTAPAQASQPAQSTQPAQARPAPAIAPEVADEQVAQALQELERLKLLIERIDAAARREGLGDRELADLRREIDPVQDQALAIALAAEPRARAVEERLEQLGPAPEEGRSESAVIAGERDSQNGLLLALQAVAKQGRLLALRAEQLSARIGERRRALFAERIFERRDSALSPVIWYEALTALPKVTGRIALLMSDWWANIRGRLGVAALAALAGLLILLGAIARPVRRRLLRFGARDPALIHPPLLRQVGAAIWLTLVHVGVPAVTLIVVYAALAAFGLLPDRIERVFAALIRAVALFSLIQGLAWGLLAPSRPTWRLLPLDTVAARRIHRLTVAIAAVYALGEFADTLNAVTFAPLAVGVAKEVLVGVLIAVLLGAVLFIARPRPATPRAHREGLVRWPWLFAIGTAGVVALFVAAVLGYPALTGFIAAQLVVGGTILGVLMLVIWLGDATVAEWIEGPEGAAERIGQTLGTGREKVVQVAIVAMGVLRIVIVLVAMSLLLVPWGIESTDVFGWLQTAFFGFTIGDITISVSSILLALAIFVIGALVTRAIQRWLDQRLLPHTSLDTGIRNSLRTGFGYLGLVVAAAVGISYLGLDLSNLAIVAGALSVGIGFGLQSVVNNFVSGLILLAERPIKVGDWIVVGGEEGYVSKISVRSTQIETFDRATVIVPNSDLISGVVKNWMHSDRMGRVRVPVGVAYGSDANRVRAVLLACAEAHPAVLRTPAPVVYFMDFGSSSLDFELRAYIGNVDSALSVRSDLRFAVLEALREAGVEIPFPQQDLHLRDIDRLEKALAGRNAAPRPRRKGGDTPQ